MDYVLKLSGDLNRYYNLKTMSDVLVCNLVFCDLCRSKNYHSNNQLNDFIYYVKQQLNITINIHSKNDRAFNYAYFDRNTELIKYLIKMSCKYSHKPFNIYTETDTYYEEEDIFIGYTYYKYLASIGRYKNSFGKYRTMETYYNTLCIL